MEIYDVHTHVGSDSAFWLRGWWPYAATVRDLLGHMDAHAIDRAVCFPFTMPSAFDLEAFADRGAVELRPGRVPFDRENIALVRELERIDVDRRLVALAMFDPSRCVAEQLSNLHKLVGRIAGLKTQSTIIQSPIRALLDKGKPLMELAREHDMPVLLHTSVDPRAIFAQASDCLDVAEAFPDIRFNLAHTLGFNRELLIRATELPNVWIDCSALLAHCKVAREGCPIAAPPGRRVDADYDKPVEVLLAVHEILGKRYLWGSDNPYMSWCDDELRIMYTYADEAEVLHALPHDVKQSMGQDAPRAWLAGPRM